MNKKLFLLIPVFLLLSSLVTAFNTTGLYKAWTLSNSTEMVGGTSGNITLDEEGGITYIAGINGNGAYCDGTNNALYTGTDAEAEKMLLYPLSITVWAKSDRITTGTTQIYNNYGLQTIGTRTGGLIQGMIGDNLAEYYAYSGNVTLNTSWHFLTITVSSTKKLNFYYDGQFIAGNQMVNNYNFALSNKMAICRESSGTVQYFNGTVDELYVFDRQLTEGEILELYNNGNGKFYPFAEPITPPAVSGSVSALSNYSTPVLENTSQNFTLMLNWTTYNVSKTVGLMEYNGTNYTAVLVSESYTSDNSSANFTFTLTVPTLIYNNTNLTVIFYYNVTNSTGTYWYNMATQYQSINYQYRHYFINATNGFNHTIISSFNILFPEGIVSATGNYHRIRPTLVTNESFTVYLDKFTNQTFTAQLTNTSATAVLYPIQLNNINYSSSFYYYDAKNYTVNFSFSLNYTCNPASVSNLDLYINSTFVQGYSLNCTNPLSIVTAFYQPTAEGASNITFYFNTSIPTSVNQYSPVMNYVADLQAPTPTLYLNLTDGFGNANINISVVCTDTIATGNYKITYLETLNNLVKVNGSYSNGTHVRNNTAGADGINTQYASCTDIYGTSTLTELTTIRTKNLALIDEVNNIAFDVQNLSTVRLYYDDNSSYYDFQTVNKTSVNFSAIDNTKLRLELEYSSGTIITRYVDVSILNESNVRLCANLEGVTHYEQLIISATERPVVLKSVFANCLIAGDYTRFAYQASNVLKAYSINRQYYLYTFNSLGQQTILASVDGSISSYINLDTLEFSQRSYDLAVKGEALYAEKTGTDQLKIYYYNLNQDNTALDLTITRTDTNAVLVNTDSFSDPNEFTLYLDYSGYTGVNESTLFKLVLVSTKEDGSTETMTRHINTRAETGTINSAVAFMISLLLLVFGLSFASARNTFSWFGLFVVLGGLFVLASAVPAWYITFMAVIHVIVAVYIFLIMNGSNSATIGG